MDVKRRLKEIFRPIDELMEALGEFIVKLYEEKKDFLPSVKSYLITTLGKRLRAGISFLVSRALGKLSEEDAVKIGAIVELIHLASLFHDDIIDRAEKRRGMEAMHKLFGPTTAVVMGDYLYIRAIDIAFSFNSWDVNRAVVDTVAWMLDGELVELFHSFDASLSEEQYFNIIAGKTASLFQLSSSLPAIVGDKDKVEAMKVFGHSFGMAFQIIDDLLDVLADEEKVGKPVLSDLKEGKVTLPYLYMLKKGDSSELLEYLRHRGKKEIDFRLLRRKLIEEGAIDYAMEKARDFLRQAGKQLEVLPSSPYRDSLHQLLDLYSNYEF